MVSKRDLISTKLIIKNNGSSAATLKLASPVEGNLLSMPDTIILQPGTIQNIPVKFLPSAELLSNPTPFIGVTYKNLNNGQSISAKLVLSIDQAGQVHVTALDPVVYINTTNGKATLRFRCVNQGYAPTRVVMKLTANPTGLQILNPLRTIQLDPGSRQIIEVEANYLKMNNNGLTPEFNVIAEVADASGTPLSTSVVQVTSLGSRRADIAAAQHDMGNISGISYTNMNQAVNYYTLSTSGNILPGSDERIDYNLNLNYYTRINAADGFDTWINYTGKHIGIRIGNVMDNLDFSLFGRGIKLSVNTGSHSAFDVYGIQNSYLLFTQTNQQLPFATSAALNYRYNSKLGEGNVAAIFNNNPLTRIQTRLVNGRFAIATGNNHALEIKAGLSNETVKGTTENKTGGAAGVNYSYQGERVGLNFNNYYSTNYYSGLQRGSISLNNRVNYRLNKTFSIFSRYALIKNAPRYLTDTLLLYAGLYNNTATYETGVNISSGRLNLGVHPYLLNQSLSRSNNQYAPVLNVNGSLRSSSKRLGIDLMYAFNGSRQVTILGDFGATNSDNTRLNERNYRSFRIMANYNDRWWGIHSLLQNAPFYLSEEAIATQAGGKYYAYSFGPDVHFTAFNNKLSVNITDYFNYTAYKISSNHSVNAQVQYRVTNGWQLSGECFYNAYSTVNNNYNLQTRIGVVKRFDRTSAPGTKKLKISFYNDANHNNQWDNGEQPLEGLVINIADKNQQNSGRMNTVSDKKGMVEYIAIKEGVYSLNLLRSNGWNLPGQVTIDLSGNKKMAIPLVKSGWLMGKIKVVKQAYVSTAPVLEGIKVVAVNDKNLVFTTLTNEAGEFELPLPVNNYQVSIEADPAQYAITNQKQQVNINTGNNKQLEFNLVDERRKVIVKQF
ncbi:carboxypeptidase-like regulatory domain-containing protein [Mucilaginibacter sp. UR6-1]|nr:carboxypeptidase-like regulatory domain-containing protein [Mucilaginibacter sp. UR6-1]